VLLAGTGDELQGMKRGIMELADIICINKADGANLESAKQAQVAFRQAMQLFPPQATGWRCPVELCSAKEKTRIDILWNCIRKFEAHQKNTGAFTTKRNEQSLYWFYLCLKQNMYQYIFQHGKNAFNLHNLEGLILEKKILPRTAAKQALEILR
jgi:LAO/AO transport system kinase